MILPLTFAGPAAAGFNPASLDNQVAWYRPGVETYTDAGSTEAGDGDAVQQINDQFNANNQIQTTALDKPTFKAAIINSATDALRSDGTNQFMLKAANSALTTFTMFALVQPLADPWEKCAIMGDDSGNWIGFNNGLTIRARIGASNKDFAVAGGLGAGAHVIHIIRTGANLVTPYVDGSPITGQTAAGDIGLYSLMADDAGTIPLSGDLGEFILYSDVLSAAEQNLAGAYLAAKGGITWTDVT